jgi:hypothetical protein
MHGPGAWAVAVAVAAMLPAAGPAAARAKADYAQQCQIELKPRGYYTYDARRGVPVVVPDQGGTQAEADALNACIRAKAAGQATAATMATPLREGAAVPSGTAAAAGPRRLVLSHLMARSLAQLPDALRRIRARYRGPVQVAQDGLCVPLK